MGRGAEEPGQQPGSGQFSPLYGKHPWRRAKPQLPSQKPGSESAGMSLRQWAEASGSDIRFPANARIVLNLFDPGGEHIEELSFSTDAAGMTQARKTVADFLCTMCADGLSGRIDFDLRA